MFSFKQRRRERIRRQPFPPEWVTILERIPFYQALSPADREELHGHILVFLDEKTFEGCAELIITDEIRVTVAAYACLLLLHRPTDYYPRMRTIFVYPNEYFVPGAVRHVGPIVVEGEGRLGESWHRGPVVLAWDSLRRSAADAHAAKNVVLHEFAHQLDDESDGHDGTPELPHRSMVAAWARVLGREHQRLIEDIQHHRPTVLDEYGATNPAEFFAVATEAFFQNPVALKKRHPALYEQLAQFYRQDPAGRTGR